MLKPDDTDVLGKVLEHKDSDKSSFCITRFSNLPDIKFTTWIDYQDKNSTIWIAKPEKWFGTETKSPPLVFKITHYSKGYIEYTKVYVSPYTGEMFEKENHLDLHIL